MFKISFRQKAIEDLNTIWSYTYVNWSEKQADIYYTKIKLACTKIANKTNAGKKYDGISKNLLGVKVNRHIIFYQIVNEEYLEIIRILHERMDLKKRIVE